MNPLLSAVGGQMPPMSDPMAQGGGPPMCPMCGQPLPQPDNRMGMMPQEPLPMPAPDGMMPPQQGGMGGVDPSLLMALMGGGMR